MGALFGGGLLAWLSVFFGWKWLFCLWGFFYIVILILLLLNTQHFSQHIKRKEASPRSNTSENSDSILSDCSTENQEVNCEDGKLNHHSENQIPFSDKNKTGKLGVTQILRNSFQTPGFLWLVCFVLTYKLGEQGVVSMLPLFLIDQGIPHDQVGVMSGIFSQIFSIAGSTVGGWIVSQHYGQR